MTITNPVLLVLLLIAFFFGHLSGFASGWFWTRAKMLRRWVEIRRALGASGNSSKRSVL